MQEYLLLGTSILFAALNNLLLHSYGNREPGDRGSVLLFNAAVSSVWWIVLGAAACFGGGLHFDAASVGWGSLYGSVTAAFLLFKMQAMATGPVSLSAFIGCSSMLISTGFGVFVLGEGASLWQTVGVALLMVALFLVVSPKNEQAQKKWKLWCAGFFLCSAAVGIIFKLHQRSASSARTAEMMLVAAAVSSVLFLGAAFAASGGRPKPLPRAAIPYALACGVAGCAYNRLNIYLAGQLPSVVFYPTFNGTVILLSTLSGVLFFRERLKKGQGIGILVGAVALVLASGTADFWLKKYLGGL